MDFFAESQAEEEWRVLCSFLADLVERGGRLPAKGGRAQEHTYQLHEVRGACSA